MSLPYAQSTPTWTRRLTYGPPVSLMIFELAISAFGTVTSTSSSVSTRVERMPIFVTRPCSSLSSTMKSPTLYGASTTMKMPENRFASVSLAAKPIAMPMMPADASHAVRSIRHDRNAKYSAVPATAILSSISNTGSVRGWTIDAPLPRRPSMPSTPTPIR